MKTLINNNNSPFIFEELKAIVYIELRLRILLIVLWYCFKFINTVNSGEVYRYY